MLGYDLSRAHWVADTQADDRFSDDKRLALHKKQVPHTPTYMLARAHCVRAWELAGSQ